MLLDAHDELLSLKASLSRLDEEGHDAKAAAAIVNAVHATERRATRAAMSDLKSGKVEAQQVHGRLSALAAALLLQVGVSFPELRELATEPEEDLSDLSAGRQERASPITKLSQQQAAIATHPSSILLQGRSGTGKTVTILQRMLHRQQQAHTAGRENPRQLFVTRSSLLRDEVRDQLESRQARTIPAERRAEALTWKEFVSSCGNVGPGFARLQRLAGRVVIDYEAFRTSCWPRLRAEGSTAAHIPPILIWTEFQNQIRSFHELSRCPQTTMV